jgi:hypothetical protein
VADSDDEPTPGADAGDDTATGDGGTDAGEDTTPDIGDDTAPDVTVDTTPDVAPDDADTVWMALSTSQDHLFRPLADTDSGFAVRALEYDALIDSWVATWRHDFDGPEGSFLARTETRSPQRTIRMEVQFDEDGAAYGTFTDRWTGFYDDRTTGGVATPGVTVFEGDFEAVRLGNGSLREGGVLP